jgi:DNA-binding NarL/FixJ family response regulator
VHVVLAREPVAGPGEGVVVARPDADGGRGVRPRAVADVEAAVDERIQPFLAVLRRCNECKALGSIFDRAAEIGVDASVEARVLVSAIKVLCAAEESMHRAKLTARLWGDIRSTGSVDTFVTIYRTAPALLRELGRNEREMELVSLLGRLGDLRLARTTGLIPEETGGLTAREHEVANLLQRGLTNKEIAVQLFISQATVKVHLRHIYEKLGVRNRASAIAKLR